ncbi:hypothetical protein AK812_SmicGene14971 [Symbiodinium microadriaticum]|uniref:Uncharacterized protein n=1 Tax=Symbiodinium microadriaticum TaxID=2951 RepID=A0A1Q9E475_SYMMI|nr:hypothetical protein AK812_SmicGene14971 [Symbiodinium microadriaticum]
MGKKATASPPEVADVMAMLQSKGLLKRGPEAAAEPSKKPKTAKVKPTPKPEEEPKVETRARTKRKPADAEATPNDEKPPTKIGKPGKKGGKQEKPSNPVKEQKKPSKEHAQPQEKPSKEQSQQEKPSLKEQPQEKPIKRQSQQEKPSKEQPQPSKGQSQEKPKEQPQQKTSKGQSQEKPSKPGKQKKPSNDEPQDPPSEDAASDDEELGPFVEFPPKEPFGDQFFETGLDMLVSWNNLDDVWRACKAHDTPLYKDMQYEELLRMMEMALGPRPKHVLKPLEVPENDLAGEERHPGPVLEDKSLQQTEEQEESEEGEDEEQDDQEGEEEEAEEDEEEEEEEEEEAKEPRDPSTAGPRAAKPAKPTAETASPKTNTWNGIPSPATKEKAQTESPKEVKPLDLNHKFNRVRRSKSEQPPSLSTLVLGAHLTDQQAYQDHPASLVNEGVGEAKEEPGGEDEDGEEHESEEEDDEEEEQHEVFAKWLEQGENMNNTEAQLIIKKTKSAEVKSGYEELTVKEMVAKGFSATKIESIVRKGGTPDADAPHCLESIVYLCRKKKNVEESEKVEQTGEIKARTKPSAKALAPLMQLNGMPGPGSTSSAADAALQLAANAFALGTESARSGDNAAAPKKIAKGKAKAKAKALIQAPKTIKEIVDECKELKKEYNAANICYDLPKDHALRLRDVVDDDVEDFAEVESTRMVRAQVRAVAAELQRKVQRYLRYEMNWHAAEIGGAVGSNLLTLVQWPVLVILICWWLIGIWFPVIRLHFFVAGFRGDWKALRQSFNFTRYADREKVQGLEVGQGHSDLVNVQRLQELLFFVCSRG